MAKKNTCKVNEIKDPPIRTAEIGFCSNDGIFKQIEIECNLIERTDSIMFIYIKKGNIKEEIACVRNWVYYLWYEEIHEEIYESTDGQPMQVKLPTNFGKIV